MHPTLEQFCRIQGVSACQPEFFRRTQRELRDTVQPLLDEREHLIEENARLREELLKATKPRAKETVAA